MSRNILGKLNHVAIATLDLDKATALYRDVLRAKVSEPVDMPAHGITTVFVEMPGSNIELMTPLGEKSPIANFLKRRPDGGVHHLCFEVENILATRDELIEAGARVLGNPQLGAHGKPVVFLHPKDFCGTLIELEQA